MFNRRTLIAFTALVAVLVSGALGFVVIEEYNWSEGIYMAAITVTTVGFGEIRPLSPAGRTFTTIYTLLSFLSVAVLLHSLAESMLTSVLSRRREESKMRKAIAAAKGHYILCGYGRMGRAAAREFEMSGREFVVVESDAERCEELRKEGILFVEGDSTQEATLLDAGIKRARGLLAMLGSDPNNLYIVLTARELNPTLHIIARVEGAEGGTEQRVLRAGADSVVSPFATAGHHVAASMLEATNAATRRPKDPPPVEGPPRKVLIIDDDPVVMRLYTRLFKRKGYHPLQATDGQTGFDLIRSEKPLVAVIDNMMPALTGIEVCQRVRRSTSCDGVGLVLFTADDHPDTRQRALDAGADRVVVKGVRALEVIETVSELLESTPERAATGKAAARHSEDREPATI